MNGFIFGLLERIAVPVPGKPERGCKERGELKRKKKILKDSSRHTGDSLTGVTKDEELTFELM